MKMKNAVMLTILVLVAGLAGNASGWNNRDIGSPSAPGSASYDAGTGKWTVTADGNDIWGHSDNFHYVYKSLMGDGKLIARVVNMSGPGTDGWAKAGVMIRSDLSGESKHALMAMTPTAGHAVAFQWRDNKGGASGTAHSGSMTFPYWVRIERVGNFFAGSHSPDGINWSPPSMWFIPMGLHAYIGLAVTSHEEGVLRTAEFDNVTIEGKIGMGTAWTYQGRLMDANQPADGLYDLRFKLYDSNDVQQENAVDINDLDVIDGDFTTELDFGSDVFDGAALWLDIGVRPGASTGSFTTLSPRYEVTPVPYSLQTRGIFVDNAYNVGIGTENPRVKLSLGAELPPTLKKLAIWDGNDDFYGFGADWGRMTAYAGDEEIMTINDTGNVGIGTTSPGARLHVQYGDSGFTPTNVRGLFVENSGGGNDYYVFQTATTQGKSFSITNAGNVGIGTKSPGAKLDVRGTVKLGVSGVGDVLEAYPTNVYLKAPNGSINFQTPNGTNRMSITSTGYTGIGTTTPTEKLEVAGTVKAISSGGNGVYAKNTDSNNLGILAGSWYGGYFEANSNQGRGIYAKGSSNGYAAEFTGNVLIRSHSTGATVMELGEGLDYAEGFDVSCKKEIGSGSVLIIDADNPGKLVLSAKAYDSKVAGIVAGAKGLGSGVRLGVGQFDYDVALAGRVYCNVDATEVAVEPGDLLTTSATSGCAMKAMDYMRAQGAILGKAMESLQKGQKGQILVLVTLQ
jgi:hypothetical protein